MLKILLLVLAIVVLIINGCATVTPVFTSFQSAKIQPNHFEFTPCASSVNYSNGEESGCESFSVGFQFAQGFRKKPFFLPFHILFSPRIRGELIASRIKPTEHIDFFFLQEFKLSLVEDMLAMSLFSMGFHISDEFFLMQIEPVTLYLTIPVSKLVEINLSSKLIGMTYNPSDDSDEPSSFIALNAGLGIGPDVNKAAIRPEISYLYNTNGDRNRFAIGIGATLFAERLTD